MANSRGGGGTIYNGSQTVTTVGTAVRLDSSKNVPVLVTSLTIVAKDNNTGRIYVGGSDVASTTNRGLAPGDSITYESNKGVDLSDVWLDASVAAEGVDFYAAV